MLDERLILEAEDCAVDVETKGELTRGYLSVSSKTLPDHDIADPAKPLRKANARVIKRADTTKFGRMLIKALG
jgi:purine nucleosidase